MKRRFVDRALTVEAIIAPAGEVQEAKQNHSHYNRNDFVVRGLFVWAPGYGLELRALFRSIMIEGHAIVFADSFAEA